MLKNMKIAGKLTVGFAVLVVIMVILSVFAIINMQTNNTNVTNLREYPTARYSNINYMAEAIMDLRRINANMTFRLGDEATLAGLLNLATQRFAEIHGYLNENEASFRADPQILDARRNEGLADIATMRQLITRYENEVIRPMNAAALVGIVGDPTSRANVEHFLDLGAAQTDQIGNLFNAMRYFAQTTMDNRQIEINETTQTTMVIMIVLTIAGVVLAIIIALVITRMITKPINEVVKTLDSVSNGDFRINFRSNLAKDETGVMTQYVYNVVDVVRSMVDDVAKFSYESNTNGDIEYRIDASKYKGSYNEMIAGLNEFTDGFVGEVVSLLDVLGQVNKGNFKAQLRKLPGKKVIMNETTDALMQNLNSVIGEIRAMVESAAVNGDLHFQIDAAKYEGGWNEVMVGLNNIALAVDAPIVEIRDVMNDLSKGDFSHKVTGNYAGDFKQIKDAVNSTIEALSGYITEIAESLTKVSGGDLTLSISREYVGSFNQIKESINNITSSLNKTLSEISAAADQVLSGAKQISASAMDLANGASTQASSVEELNASVDLINQQTKANAASASEANDLSRKSTDNAREGNDAMKQTLGAMNQIKESSNNISKIIRTIQDIAFQTNLLALNAAVEAARAGEHGRGFAVVAEEVRSLAARSQTAASETTELINGSVTTVEAGSEIAQSTAESLDTIVENANKVLGIVDTIASASQEQAEAISQVGMGLQQVSSVVQSNSAVSEEAAAAAEELNSQAEILQQLVGFFKL